MQRGTGENLKKKKKKKKKRGGGGSVQKMYMSFFK